MSAGTIWACIGSGIAGISAGIVGGIFIGKAIRQKRCNAEIDSVKESYRKYFKDQVEETEEPHFLPDRPETESATTTKERTTVEPYKILTKEKAIEIANSEEIDIEELVVNDQGHSLYVPDYIMTTKLGMEPSDIAELINSTGEHIFVKNNIDGKLYEVFSPEPI